jgi:rRNA pseudouridine-1189 N-methylase Emg1 (Nep1/Mra1 family)
MKKEKIINDDERLMELEEMKLQNEINDLR